MLPGPRTLRSDLLAGLTVTALLAPESVAYAQIAGIPPQFGLVAAPVTLLAYAVLGRSTVLAVGATAATAVLSGATVAQLSATPAERLSLTAALALLTGCLLVVTGLARCGFLVRFLTPEALTGFLSGLAAVVLIRQAGVFAHVPAGTGNAFARAGHVLVAAPSWHLLSLLVGVATLTVLLLLERWRPQLPSTLLVLILAWVVSAALGLADRGVTVVGPIPSVIPMLRVPQVGATAWVDLAPGALGLALIVFVMSYSVSSRTAGPDEPLPSANREMIALGVANVLAGLVGGLASGGSPSASAAARGAGARTKVTTISAAVLMLAVAAFCTPAFADLPEPALAAVVVAAVRRFLAVGTFRRYLRQDRSSLGVAATALLGVLAFDLLPGLLLAVALSLVLFIGRAGRLRVSELGQVSGSTTYLAVERYPDVRRTPGLAILRPDGELFFANAHRLITRVDDATRSGAGIRVVLLDLTGSFDLRLTELDALALLRQRLSRSGVELWFVHLYLSAADAVARSELADVMTFTDTQAAADAFVGLPAAPSRPALDFPAAEH